MADPSQIVRSIGDEESVATFERRGLHLHVVTREPLLPDEVRTIQRVMRSGRSVRIRTERPSLDVRLEGGL